MTRSGSHAVHNRPDPDDGQAYGRVLPFRRPAPLLPVSSVRLAHADPEAADQFAAFEQERLREDSDHQGALQLVEEREADEVIDYRQRMVMNVIAVVVVALLVSTGVWLADAIAEMQRNQDCMLQGRVNCAPIEYPAPPPE